MKNYLKEKNKEGISNLILVFSIALIVIGGVIGLYDPMLYWKFSIL